MDNGVIIEESGRNNNSEPIFFAYDEETHEIRDTGTREMLEQTYTIEGEIINGIVIKELEDTIYNETDEMIDIEYLYDDCFEEED